MTERGRSRTDGCVCGGAAGGGSALGSTVSGAPRAHPEPTRSGAGGAGAGAAPRSPRRSRSTISRPPHAGVCAPAPPPSPALSQQRAVGPPLLPVLVPRNPAAPGGTDGPGRAGMSCPDSSTHRALFRHGQRFHSAPDRGLKLCRGDLTRAAPFPSPGFFSTRGDRAPCWGLLSAVTLLRPGSALGSARAQQASSHAGLHCITWAGSRIGHCSMSSCGQPSLVPPCSTLCR